MDTTTLIIVGVIALLVIIALYALAGRSRRVAQPVLQPLTPEARDRYVTKWDQIEARFVEAPQEAVQEADALVLALLAERGHPLAENRLPERVRMARRQAAKSGTEGMRRAILYYRAVVEEMARVPEKDLERLRQGRRETA